jgi:hypothetical protein
MIRSMAGLTVRVTINTLFYEGSGRRAELTPFTIPIPTITMTPTVIQRGGICAKCAPIAKPTIRIQNPTMYKPKDIRHPGLPQHVAGRSSVATSSTSTRKRQAAKAYRTCSAFDRQNRVKRRPGPPPFHLRKARLSQQPLILAQAALHAFRHHQHVERLQIGG